MAVIKTQNSSNSFPHSLAMVRNGGGLNNSSLNWSVSGVTGANIDAINARYDLPNPPFAVASGFALDTSGAYILPPNNGPCQEFFVENLGNNDIEVGINVESSGVWSTGNGLVISSGQSHRFGSNDSQIIRNVWGISRAGTNQITGYATNLKTWV